MPAEEMNEQQRVDFFVSYTGADVAWAEWVAWVLEEAGLTTLVQAWDFRPGSNFAIDMHDALRRADRVMPLLSEAYLGSAFGAAEWAEAFASDPMGHHGRLLPVRVGDCRPDGLLRAVVYVDIVGQDEAEARRRLLAGVGRRRAKPDRPVAFPATRVALSPSHPFPGKLPAIWNVPARNPNFAGRDTQLDELRATLGAAVGAAGAAVAVLAISGLGGVGKSQLAIEHAWRRAADYDLVWWVPAEVPATPRRLPRPAGRAPRPAHRRPGGGDGPAARRAAPARLLAGGVRQRRGPRGPRRLRALRRGRARAGHVPQPGLACPGGDPRPRRWSVPDTVAFLRARTASDDQSAARSVAEELGLLPLALEQAGAYVEETGMALAAYRGLLPSRRREMLERGTPAFYRQTVAATFSFAYDRALEQTPGAAHVLGICALLAPDDIPAELVATGDPLADEDALGALRRLALLRRQGDSITLHRLVGAVVRERLGDDEAASRAGAAIAALRRAFPDTANDYRSWPRSARLLPHVLALAQHCEGTDELAWLLKSAGVYLSSRGQLRSAYQVLERACGIFEAAHGPDHPEVARTLSNLGVVLRDLGDLAGARDHQERALAVFGAVYGPDHPQVAITLGSLGIVLRDLGDLGGAREHQERALGIKEKMHGPDHPEVAITLTNLGLVLRDLGDLACARERLERALEINEAVYGPDHPEVALALMNLGLVLRDLG